VKTKPRVIFRVDESIQVGFGHMSRCLALADAIARANIKVEFWSISVRLSTRKSLEQLGAKLVDLIDHHTFLDQDWQDSIVVVDGYHFDEIFWQSLIAKSPIRTVCIDDYRSVQYWADIVVCNNTGVHPKQFKLAQNTRLFLGEKYVLLRPEILLAASQSARTSGRRVVMIVSGGTEQENWVATMLSHMAHVKPGVLLWVLSGRRLRESRVLYRSRQEKAHVRFFSGLNAAEMLRRYSQVRCLIAPASTVMLEAFTIGCPLVTGWMADNQRNSLDYLSRNGLVINAGDFRNVSARTLGLSYAKAVRESRPMKRKQREYIQNSKNGINEVVGAILGED
jgi:UDP-2,4-diacetamido-2,4,6-trideoxy-beta-L-altropyranose hydrolase